MVDRGERAAAWPLLEESLRTFRQLGLPRGEAQVLAYLAEKPTERAISPARSSSPLRAPRSPTRLARHGGRADSSPVPPSSSASAEISMPPKVMRSAHSSSPWASVTVGKWCSPRPSLLSSPQNAGTPSRPAVSGGYRKRTDLPACPTVGEPPREPSSSAWMDPAFARARTKGRLLSIAEAAGLRQPRPVSRFRASSQSPRRRDSSDAVATDEGHLGTDSGDRFGASRGDSRRAGEGIDSRLNYEFAGESAL